MTRALTQPIKATTRSCLYYGRDRDPVGSGYGRSNLRCPCRMGLHASDQDRCHVVAQLRKCHCACSAQEDGRASPDGHIDVNLVDDGDLLSVRLNVSLPSVERQVAQALLEAAHKICHRGRPSHEITSGTEIGCSTSKKNAGEYPVQLAVLLQIYLEIVRSAGLVPPPEQRVHRSADRILAM